MLFYTFIIFNLIREVFNFGEDLQNTVETYYTQRTSVSHKDYYTGKDETDVLNDVDVDNQIKELQTVSKVVIIQSIHNLRYIIAQMKIIKLKNLTSEKRKTIQILDCELEICEYVPKYLDLILIYTNGIQEILTLYILFQVLCKSWMAITDKMEDNLQIHNKISTKIYNKTYKKYDKNSVRLLKKILEHHYFFTDRYKMPDSLIDVLLGSAFYIRDVFNILNHSSMLKFLENNPQHNIDIIPGLSTDDGKNYNVGGKSLNTVNIITNDQTENNSQCQELKNETNDIIKMHNDYYVKQIKEECNEILPDSENDILKFTYSLMDYTFSRLRVIFKPQIAYNFENNIVYFKKNFCQFAPTVIFYLNDNIGYNDKADNNMITMYYIYCSHLIYYSKSRCPNNIVLRRWHSQCVHQTIQDIVFVNLRTQGIIDHEHVDSKVCPNSMFKYIQDIYNVIYSYYNVRYNVSCFESPVWTTFDWLGGQEFINSDREHMKKLKNETMIIHEVSIPLSLVYENILPWNMKMDTIMFIHNFILDKLDKYMTTFFYRHMLLVITYLQSLNKEIDNKLLIENIQISIGWYNDEKSKLYKYLRLSNTYEPNQNTNKIMKLFEKESVLILDIEKFVPSEVFIWLTDEVLKNHTPGLSPEKKVNLLREAAISNCIQGNKFMDLFTSLSKWATTIKKPLGLFNSIPYNDICNENMTKFFKFIVDLMT